MSLHQLNRRLSFALRRVKTHLRHLCDGGQNMALHLLQVGHVHWLYTTRSFLYDLNHIIQSSHTHQNVGHALLRHKRRVRLLRLRQKHCHRLRRLRNNRSNRLPRSSIRIRKRCRRLCHRPDGQCRPDVRRLRTAIRQDVDRHRRGSREAGTRLQRHGQLNLEQDDGQTAEAAQTCKREGTGTGC